MKNYLFIVFSLILLLVEPSFANTVRRDIRGDKTVNNWSRYTSVSVLADKSSFNDKEKINIRFRVKNVGYHVLRIYPSTNGRNSFKFLVLDKNGREVKPKLGMANETTSSLVVNLNGDPIKEIILAPGEVFEKSINLNKFYTFQSGIQYRIKGYFWPDIRSKELFLKSENIVRLKINKSEAVVHDNNGFDKRYQRDSREPILTPEETIYLFLSAEMRRNWKNHLKYLDMKRYITAYDRFSSKYVQASSSQKSRVIRRFEDFLISEPADRLRKFTIKSSKPINSLDQQMQEHGRYTVKVSALRADRGFSARYEYNYTLEKFSDSENTFWKIIYVEATLKNSGSGT